jgi:hypothetical protein
VILPFSRIPVELLDTILDSTVTLTVSINLQPSELLAYLESVRMLVPCPLPSFGMEEQPLLILLTHVAVQVLGKSKLSM